MLVVIRKIVKIVVSVSKLLCLTPEARCSRDTAHSPQHRPSAYLDNTRIREEVGYRPEHTIERAITEYID